MSMGGESLGNARFSISGDSSSGVGAVHRLNSALASLEESVATNWWGLQNLAGAFTALPAAVAAGVAASVRAASTLEDAMTGVIRTTNIDRNPLGEAAVEGLKQQLLDLGRTRAIPTIEIFGIAEASGALGVATEDIGRFTSAVADFSALTGVTVDASATALARLSALLNVNAAGFDNLASSIYTAGVNTAATEEDIVNIATRIAGAGAVIGLSADEVVGWSAAIRSAGERPEAGGTSIQKFFQDIDAAVRSGGEELEAWARIAGTSGEEFRRAFAEDSNAALLLIVKRLGELGASGENVTAMLDEVGIRESRQLRTLGLLAVAQQQNVNKNAQLSTSLDYAKEGLIDTSTAAERTADRANTLSGQLELLKNAVFASSSTFGTTLLPVLKAVFGFIRTMVTGFTALPPVVQQATFILVGIATVILGLIAALSTLVPRMVIASGAMRQIGQSGLLASIGIGRFSVASAAAAATTEVMAGTTVAATAAMKGAEVQGAKTATTLEAVAGAGAAAGAGMGTAAAGATGLGRAAGFASKAILPLMIAMAALGIASYKQGQQRMRELEEIQKAEAANTELTKIIRDQKAAIGEQSTAWVKAQDCFKKASAAAEQLGISNEDLINVITTGDQAADSWKRTMDAIVAAEENGSESASQLRVELQTLFRQYKNSREEAGFLALQLDENANANMKLGETAAQSAEELKKQREEMERTAQAVVDYIDAGFSLRQAQLDLRDAEQNLSEARQNAAQDTLKIRQAELALTQARFDQVKADRALEKAQQDLLTARDRAAAAVLNAEDQLFDSQDRLFDLQEKTLKQEEDLADLRAGSAREVLRATNQLRKAYDDLRDSEQDVLDAEWQLQYLREEGASARDILNAEEAIRDARDSVAYATESVANAQDDLFRLTDPVQRARAIEKAERELASTRRDMAQTIRDISENERNLADARKDQANDTLYLEAQEAIIDAELRQVQAVLNITKAEQDLARLRSGSGIRDLERAQLDYEKALWDTARANVEVQKQTTLMNGGTWDAAQNAWALRDALKDMHIEQGEANAKREEWIKILERSPKSLPKEQERPAYEGEPFDLSGMIPPTPTEPLFNIPEKLGLYNEQSLWEQLKPIGLLIGAYLLKAIIVGIAAALGVSVGWVALGVAVVALIIYGIYWALQNTEFGKKVKDWIVGAFEKSVEALKDFGGWIYDAINSSLDGDKNLEEWLYEKGKDIIQGLWNGITDWFDEHWQDFQNIWDEEIMKPFETALGISSPSTVFNQYGKDIVQGLWNGIVQKFSEFYGTFQTLPQRIKNVFNNSKEWLRTNGSDLLQGLKNGAGSSINKVYDIYRAVWDELGRTFSNTGNWLYSKGQTLLNGLYDGASSKFSRFGNVAWEIWNKVTSPFSNVGDWLWAAGHNLILGLRNGIWWAFDNLLGPAWNRIIGWIPQSIKDALGIKSPSRVFEGLGENLMVGLVQGIEGQMGSLNDALEQIVQASTMDLTNELKAMNLDYMLTPVGMGDLGSVAVNTMPVAHVVNNNYYDETLNLEAVTTADPEDIVNEYVWSKKVKIRGR